MNTQVRTFAFSEILGAWQERSYYGTVALFQPLGTQVRYCLLTGKCLSFISSDLPTNLQITASLIVLLVAYYRQKLKKKIKSSPQEFLAVAVGAQIFHDADLDRYLNQQTQTYQVELDRLAECTPQGFLHTGIARGLFTKGDVDQCLQQYLLSKLSHLLKHNFAVQLVHQPKIDWQVGIPIEDLLAELGVEGGRQWQFLDLVSFPLTEAQAGDQLYIQRLQSQHNSKLLGMGLAVGTALEVIQVLPESALLVAVGEQRLGLSAEMTAQIWVVKAQDWQEVKPMAQHREIKLAQVSAGSRLRVVGYAPTAREYKHRLLAMGLTPGVEILMKRRAPLGDPIEIQVRGFDLSLRKDEAEALRVTMLEGETL